MQKLKFCCTSLVICAVALSISAYKAPGNSPVLRFVGATLGGNAAPSGKLCAAEKKEEEEEARRTSSKR
jgi:hypothetical protein